jgi:SnoaL-like domain
MVRRGSRLSEPGRIKVEISEVVAIYHSAWNESDEAKRTAILERSWADNGVYRDPDVTVEGRAALVTHIGGFQASFPGRTIDQTSRVDSNGVEIRWAWEMRNGDATEGQGCDVAELAPDGRIQRIAGFFGPLPPLGD